MRHGLRRELGLALLLPAFACGDGIVGGDPAPVRDASVLMPDAGNEEGRCDGGEAVRPRDVSSPTTVIGTGTKESCTGLAFVEAVAQGGVITFDCGPDPITLVVPRTAKVRNDAAREVVIDGGGRVALSGGGVRRILYMNTCDPDNVWTTAHCDDQDHPSLTLQNIAFVDGNSTGESYDGGGGGAVFTRGGRVRILNARFFGNRCDASGPDVGGGAVRILDVYDRETVVIANTTFGGEGDLANTCSNGGALSTIGASFRILNSVFTHNRAIGRGANPARPGTPGGGNGGALYGDGNTFTFSVCGTRIEDNHANEGGGAIFFVSNDRTGSLRIESSTLTDNESAGFETAGFPGIFVLANGDPVVVDSTLR